MKRRRFILLSASGLVVAGAGAGTAGLWLRGDANDSPAPAMAHLHSLARSMSGAAIIGRAWVEQHGEEDAAQSLLNSLGLEADESLSFENFIDRLADRVETDLDQGTVFIHDGWWLAETEARLASLHVELLGDAASKAEATSFDTAREEEVVQVEDFQPKSVRQGEAISRPGLPNGVIRFATAEPPPVHLVIMLSGRRLTVRVTDRGFSIRVPGRVMDHLNANPGDHDIWVYDPVTNRRQYLGHFTVETAEPGEIGFCAVERWGPKSTTAGHKFNEQADGLPAIWIRIGCYPPETVVVFNGVELPTTLRPDEGLITANFPDPTLYESAGNFELALMDHRSGQTQPVGEFIIEAAPAQ